jgi:hypothetical protein
MNKSAWVVPIVVRKEQPPSSVGDSIIRMLCARIWSSTHWHLRLMGLCYGVDEAGWPLRDDPEAAS